MSIKQTLVIVSLSLVLLISSACSSPAIPTATPPPTATPIPPTRIPQSPTPTPIVYDGSWSGTTSQGKSISFDIQDHGITFMEADFEFQLTGCSISGPTNLFTTAPQVFSENSFSIKISSSTTVSGQFDSDSTASGTIQVKVTSGCSGTGEATWTATKQ